MGIDPFCCYCYFWLCVCVGETKKKKKTRRGEERREENHGIKRTLEQGGGRGENKDGRIRNVKVTVSQIILICAHEKFVIMFVVGLF